MYEAGPQPAADTHAVSVDHDETVISPSGSKHTTTSTVPRKAAKTKPVRVNCLPLPPKKEYNKPRATGIYHYAIYIREGAIENYAVQVNPKLAKADDSLQYVYGLDYLRALVGDRDESLRINFADLRRRHKEAMPFITDDRDGPVLSLFELDEEAFKHRMSAENVEKLVKALDCKPDWFEISIFV
ncbi:hypothetical protein L226DRAFT_576656 [Lentinus tigrinus ALCF2SS1-7]|uniref:Uncharacterized protein n=1 Tax=Lentinus tigrinus ALCF2SS1-6 TaxID=1328759 RepID=A0A5C2RRW3_9APHY|nr:hypothetical protein L227DRAFT_617425 [Lentinus tigrinus ALCF2SS1-6]RPD68135.1 hypothetical protein L226DRAFT_576656 [Lentinus tigrinus ALCF2SS1-7]